MAVPTTSPLGRSATPPMYNIGYKTTKAACYVAGAAVATGVVFGVGAAGGMVAVMGTTALDLNPMWCSNLAVAFGSMCGQAALSGIILLLCSTKVNDSLNNAIEATSEKAGALFAKISWYTR